MDIWEIVAIAIVVVLVSILWLRLHAFLALTLSGFLVAALTSDAALENYAKQQMDKPKNAWTQQQAAILADHRWEAAGPALRPPVTARA